MDAPMSNITIGTINSVEGNTNIEDSNGIIPDSSIVKKRNKKFKISGSYMYGESSVKENSNMSIAKIILNEYNSDKFDTPENAWKHQAKYDLNVNKFDVDTLRMNEVPYDIMEILLNADPASANSFVYHMKNLSPDKLSKLLCKIDDSTSVYLRSGSAVVFKNKDCYSYNREALTNLKLSSPLV